MVNPWKHVSRQEPCPACGRADWCKLAVDGSATMCRRSPEGPLGPGDERRDCRGEPFWVHRLQPGPGKPERLVPELQSTAPPAAEPELLDRVYRDLLNRLPLEGRHREDLVARGFTAEEIAEAGFRTMPERGRKRLAEALVHDHGEDLARRVPGIYVKTDASGAWWSLAGAAGLLVPVRDLAARIVGLRTRRDDASDGRGRYPWVSSSRHGGPGPASGVHVPHGPRGPVVRLTEGELKADLATARTGILTVSVAGVGRWREALSVLVELAPEKVLLAFDADARTNPVVARALTAAARGLAEAGLRVALETWPEPSKGIDDALVAGAELVELEGPELAAELALVAGAELEPEELLSEARRVAPAGNVVPLRRPRQSAARTEGALALAVVPEANPEPRGYNFKRTDLGNAELLSAVYGDAMRFCHAMKAWFVWDGNRWKRDETNLAGHLANLVARKRLRDASELEDERRKEEAKHALASESSGARRACLDQATCRPELAVVPEALDADPWLLCVENGTVDLRSGTLRPSSKQDLLTRQAPVKYDQSATCPTWEAFLERIMAGNAGLISYLRRAVGYSLSGAIREHVLFLAYGRGANGKSTLLETVAGLLGPDFAHKLQVESLLESARPQGGGAANDDVADLRAKRFAFTTESGRERKLAEATVKALTGADTVAARRLYENTVRFKPTHKLWLATNHRPQVQGSDHGIWRRLHLVPFEVQIPENEQDQELQEKLLAELPGILAWAVQGCLEWQREGLNPPPEVLAETARYREEQDTFGTFLAERTTTAPRQGGLFPEPPKVLRKELFANYLSWCAENAERPMSAASFAAALDERGFQDHKGAKGNRFRLGLRLLEESDAEEDHATLGGAGGAGGAFSQNFSSELSHGDFSEIAPPMPPMPPAPSLIAPSGEKAEPEAEEWEFVP